MAGIAVVGATDPPPLPVHGADTVIFELEVQEAGNYVVFARVVLQNNDGDAQNATVRISHSNRSNLMDWVNIRVPSGAAYAVSLQGTLVVTAGNTDFVVLSCETFNGAATR